MKVNSLIERGRGMSELEFFEEYLEGAIMMDEECIAGFIRLGEMGAKQGMGKQEIKERTAYAVCMGYVCLKFGISAERLAEMLYAENASLQTGDELLKEMVDHIDPD